MPRRNGCFQKALVVWFEANRSRFVLPACLKMVKGGRVAITLRGQPACLSITASPHNLGVWVSWQGVNWDALLDLDVFAAKTPDGFRCILCEDSPFKIWPSREALWADHLFEEFYSVKLFGAANSMTMTRLHPQAQMPDDDERALATVPLHCTPQALAHHAAQSTWTAAQLG